MSYDNSNNNRIVKNTILLYLRMFLLMGVGLYTSRINLLALGVDGFGVYNVVAGFIVMFGAVTGSMGNAISRFLQVELGKRDYDRLKSVFSTAINVQLIMAIVVAIIGEMIGMWFLNNKLQIPQESFFAAKWILHFSIIQFAFGLLMVPYNASIISHERMGAFAYLSILEAILKLTVAFFVLYTPCNKLITYGCLLMCNQLLMNFIYLYYCTKNFEECHYRFAFDKDLLKQISGFAGWNLFSQASYVLNIQGTNMLLNVYFGVTVNAARGVANQVNSAVQQFINSFMTAVIPQITKCYAAGDKQNSFKLVCMSSKYSYFLMFLLSLPIILEADYILDIWLKEPPEYAVSFVRWQLAATLTTVFGNPLFNLIMADGRIKKFQVSMAVISFIPFILAWICFGIGAPAYFAYVMYFSVYFLLIFVRFYLVNRVTGIPASDYLYGVIFKVVLVSVISVILPLGIHCYLCPSFLRLIIVGLVCLLVSASTIYTVGLTNSEKQYLIEQVKLLLTKIK